MKANEIKALEAEIIAHQDAYQAGKPVISDAEYDALTRKLEAVKPDSKALARIGIADGKVAHTTPMLSLQKAYTFADVECWWACDTNGLGNRLMASYKLDGIACSLRYESGKLVCASTRGDGLNGMDITANVLAADAIPSELATAETIEIRGELVLRASDYEALKVKKSGRNAVAGAVNGKVTDITRALHFVAYDVIGSDCECDKFATIERLGFEVAPHRSIEWSEVEALIREWTDARSSYAYEIDGIVFKLEEVAHQAALGATKHHPRGAIAYKFGCEVIRTTVKAIDITVGAKTGKETPVIVFEPIMLSGASVSKASMGSMAKLAQSGIKVGDVIEVTRQGGVIPKIIGRIA
jgi:DNA ligase (NAD+)